MPLEFLLISESLLLSSQQSGSAVNLTGNANVVDMDAANFPSGLPHPVSDSTSSAVLAMQEMMIGHKSGGYEQNPTQQKDLGGSLKVG